MRKTAFVLLALAVTGCARQVYSSGPAPVETRPVSAPARPAVVIDPVTSTEAVDYLLARGMLIPVAGVSVSQLHDTFDEGRDGGRVHRALDIMAPRGTPVLSADSGRILRISSNTLGGNIVYATDPLGRVVYYYAHLDAYQPGLTQGAMVARGDTLGFVGTTGNAPKDTPHLHFQVMRMPSDGKYWDGEPINPYPLILLSHEAARP
ncbi:MAG: Peptidase [Gemmatimonadetes bacterium]|jgi:murein DD-endopeptidase MepM/ murein hydrolase activator NlpD|nr:Peptidase [Gemmatimonadota bacterium]